MSVTYPQYTNTQFPDQVDTINNFVDITLSTLPLAQQYYSLYNSGDIAGATAILEANPSLKYSYIGAATLNPIVDAIKAIQLFYTQDVQKYLVNIIVPKGDYSGTTKYSKYNTVQYLHNGAIETFMCISNDMPIGTLPTNTTYWVYLTMRGEKGEAGTGLTVYGSWNSATTYPIDAMVSHNNCLWGALISNTNIEPSDTANTTWFKIMQFTADLLNFVDGTTSKKYTFTINNGLVYLTDGTTQLDVALKSDIPTTLPANGGTAQTISETLPITKGGTGATTSSEALTNLGITATTTELNYMDGVTSNVQEQFNGKASSSHTHVASNVTAGTLGGQVVANATAVTNLGTAQVRNIKASTIDLTAGTSALATGDIYIVYE